MLKNLGGNTSEQEIRSLSKECNHFRETIIKQKGKELGSVKDLKNGNGYDQSVICMCEIATEKPSIL